MKAKIFGLLLFFAWTLRAVSAPVIGSGAQVLLNGAEAADISVDVSEPPSLSVNVSDATKVWIAFTLNGSTSYIYLTNPSGDTWEGTFPKSHAGVVTWKIFASDGTETVSSGWQRTLTYTETIGVDRRIDTAAAYSKLNSSIKTEIGTSTTKWTYRNCYVFDAQRINLAASVAGSAVNSQGSLEQYRVANGVGKVSVGTLYLKAQFRKNASSSEGEEVEEDTTPGTLVIESSIRPNAAYTVVKTLEILPTTDAVQYAVPINEQTAKYWRIRNATVAASSDTADRKARAIEISDVYFAPVSPDVEITKAEMDYEPGYPSVQDPITFTISLANKFENFPAANFTPVLIWRQEGGAWNETLMVNTEGETRNGDGTYTCTLTPEEIRAGSFEYLYRVAFTGYAGVWDFNPKSMTIANADDFSIYINKDGDIIEAQAPAYYRDFRSNYEETFEPAYQDFYHNDYDESHLYNLLSLDEGYPHAINDSSKMIEGAFVYNTFNAADGVRRFRSNYSEFNLKPADYDPENPSGLEASYPMMQVGDYTWQAIVYVTNAVDSVFSVVSTDFYTEGASEFGKAHVWGEVGQDETAINPPMSGTIEAHEEGYVPENCLPVRIQIDYKGFLMFRFDTRTGAYQVRRAAWQDFNAWQADEDYYSRSFGLYDTKTFYSDLNDRSLTHQEGSAFSDADETQVAAAEDMKTMTYVGGVILNNAWIDEEGKLADDTVVNGEFNPQKNLAYRLSSARNYPGSVQTTSITGGDGRGEFTMRARATWNDDQIALYSTPNDDLDEFNTTEGVQTLAKIDLSAIGEGRPQIIAYGLYKDPDNYMAAIFTQDYKSELRNGAVNNIPVLKTELGIMVNGTWTSLKTVTRDNFSMSTGDYVSLQIKSASSFAAVYYRNNNVNNSGAQSEWNLYAEYKKAISGLSSGKIGFNVKDLAGSLSPSAFPGSATVSTTASKEPAYAAVASSPETSWNLHGDASYDYTQGDAWTFTPATGAMGCKLVRATPRAFYRIKVYRSGLETSSDFLAPVPTANADWDTGWDFLGNHTYDQILEVNSLTWKNIKIPMNFWDDTYICVQALPANGSQKSTGSLMLDDLNCTHWRGVTIYDQDFQDDNVNATRAWHTEYGAIVEQGREGREYELARSRANPSKNQFIETPYLDTGIGDILFSYRVSDAPVQIEIEIVPEDGTDSTTIFPTEGGDGVLPVSDEVQSLYVAALSDVKGRLRVSTKQYFINDVEQFGTIHIDDLRATDYPNESGTSWEAYNVLISPFRNQKGVKFDGDSALAETYRSAVLNDGTQRNTLQNYDFNEGTPHIQTPSIATGVGEISFWYRSSPDNVKADGTVIPSRIYLKVAKAATTPESEWVTLSIEDLNEQSATYAEQVAALQALDHITTTEWTYFSAEFFQRDYAILRVYSELVENPGTEANRVMLDNVLITEPVRSSIDVGSIVFTPDIPLHSTSVGAIVTLVNPRMNPTDINVYLDYYVGTNKWGYATPGRDVNGNELPTWGSAPTGTITFTNAVDAAGEPIRYTFASVEEIPRGKIDDVVQYCARVTYKGTFAEPIFSETQGETANGFWFKNPAWYEPVDLNKTFGTDANPVAHYWVFSCTTNVVMFNEVAPDVGGNYNALSSNYEKQYIELLGPYGTDITGWTIEHPERDGSRNYVMIEDTTLFKTTITAPGTFTLPSSKATEEANEKGWGVYVIGQKDIASRNQLLFNDEDAEQAKKDILARELNTKFMYAVGALTLKRSMGAIVDKVYWTYSASASGNTAVNRNRFVDELGFTFLGVRTATADAAFSYEADVNNEAGLAWSVRANNKTAGDYNNGQEERLNFIDVALNPEPGPQEKPEVANLRITDVQYGEGMMDITFAFEVANGVALSADDYDWELQTRPSVFPVDTSITSGISYHAISPAPESEDGAGTITHTVRVSLEEADTSRFYRIVATPK